MRDGIGHRPRVSHTASQISTRISPQRKYSRLPGLVVMLFESYGSYRQIHTDGRPLPPEPREPSWFGYWIGKWEGDTLVVETVGVNETSGWVISAIRTAMPFASWNSSKGRTSGAWTFKSRLMTRRRIETVDARFYWEFVADTELLDWVCENNRYFDIIRRRPSQSGNGFQRASKDIRPGSSLNEMGLASETSQVSWHSHPILYFFCLNYIRVRITGRRCILNSAAETVPELSCRHHVFWLQRSSHDATTDERVDGGCGVGASRAGDCSRIRRWM